MIFIITGHIRVDNYELREVGVFTIEIRNHGQVTCTIWLKLSRFVFKYLKIIVSSDHG